jgi:hypothetical protein
VPRRALIRLLPLLALAATMAAAYPVVRGRTAAAFPQLSRTKQALEEARRADAAAFAPQELAAAEAAFRAASAEHRRQEVRFVSFRDFRAVRGSLAAAERLCRDAADAARRARRGVEEEAGDALAAADRAVAAARDFADAMPLGTSTRAAYRKACLALDEARIHARRHDFGAALASARRAESLATSVARRAASVASRYRDPAMLRQWRRWIDETVAWSRRNGEPALIVDKDGHHVTLYERGKRVRTFDAELGTNWTADKSRSGDAATPEGRYKVAEKKGRGQSIYHKALLLDYPNAEDRAAFKHAQRRGDIPRGATPGGLIEIHGEGGKGRDWTRGCVALTNRDMDAVFARVKVGTPVTIVGSDGDGGALGALAARHGRGAEAPAP